jgi:hypothetical protein
MLLRANRRWRYDLASSGHFGLKMVPVHVSRPPLTHNVLLALTCAALPILLLICRRLVHVLLL